MDKEILELLHSMAENINELKVGQKETNKKLDKIETDVKELETEVKGLKTEVKAIDKKIDTLYNAVAETKEDITKINQGITLLDSKVIKIQNVTRNNSFEIANLKAANDNMGTTIKR